MITCLYCIFYQESPTRIDSRRFCNHVQKMVDRNDEVCEDGFSANNTFWCVNTQQWIDLPVCSARQDKGMLQECRKCHQKEVILEVRRTMGIKNRVKKVLVKSTETKENPYEEKQEEIKTLQKKSILKKEPIITSEQKPTLHKKIKEPEQKPMLHKKNKE